MSSKAGRAPKPVAGRRLRRYPRYRCDFPLTATLFAGTTHQSLAGHCRDLSAGGLGALVAADLPTGEVISLTFSLPGSTESWKVRSVLRYRRGYHYGFEFLSLSESHSKTLEIYLPGLPRIDFD